MTHREGVREGGKEKQEAICMQRQRDSPLLQCLSLYLSLFLSLCLFLSPSISSSYHPAFSHFRAVSLSRSLPLSSTFSPLSFALRLAATADLNNSAQAGILQGPIVCARQENEKERDREREGKRRGGVCRAVCVYECVCVCM